MRRPLSWPSSYFVPDRASRTRRKRHRVRVGLFKDALQAKEPTKWIYEGYRPVFVVRCRLDSGYDCFHGLEQTHRFARRARDHARIYRGEYSVASIIDIERIRKKKKSHRGALNQATSFISCEVEETSAQFDEAEAAIEPLLEAQQHTDTTTTT